MSFVLPAGTIVDERFEILSLVGKGGIGTVYRARQAGIERIVAIKFLQDSTIPDEENQERFKREGLALSLLQHPGIPVFYQFGFWSERIPFIVMEFLEGKSLKQEILSRQRMNWQSALVITKQICAAMQEAHNKGIVHRDLKAENILLIAGEPEESAVKVFDFGLARFSSTENPQKTLTETGLLVGSVNYMSPEQCRGARADHRSDIYSLSCILYEMLSGSLPYEADLPIGVINKHLTEPIPQLPSNLGLPAGLEAVVRKGMSKDPNDRHQSMSEIMSSIELIESGRGKEIQQPRRASILSSKALTIMFTALGLLAIAGFGIASLNKPKPEFIVQDKSSRSRPKAVRSITGFDTDMEKRAASLVERGRYSDAIAMMKQIILQLEKKGFQRDANSRRVTMAEYARRVNDLTLASAVLDDALKNADPDDHQLYGMVLHGRAMTLMARWQSQGKLEDLKRAEKLFLEEQEHWKYTDSALDAKRNAGELAQCMFWLGKYEEAYRLLKVNFPMLYQKRELIHLKRGTGDAEYSRTVYVLSGYLFLRLGKQDEAAEAFRCLELVHKELQESDPGIVRIFNVGLPPGYKDELDKFCQSLVPEIKAMRRENFDVLLPAAAIIGERLNQEKNKPFVLSNIERLTPPPSSWTIDDLILMQLKFAILANKAGEPAKAELLLKSAELLSKSQGFRSANNLISTLFWKGLTYESIKKYPAAIKAYEEAIQRADAVKGDSKPIAIIADIYMRLYILHLEMRKIAVARAEQTEAEKEAAESARCFEQAYKVSIQYPKIVSSGVVSALLCFQAKNLREENKGDLVPLLKSFHKANQLLEAMEMNQDACFGYYAVLREIATELMVKDSSQSEAVWKECIYLMKRCKFQEINSQTDCYRALALALRQRCLKLDPDKNRQQVQSLRLEAKECLDHALELAATHFDSLRPEYAAAIITEYGGHCWNCNGRHEFDGRSDYMLSCVVRLLDDDQQSVPMFEYLESVHKISPEHLTEPLRKRLLKQIDTNIELLRSNKSDLTIWPAQTVRLIVLVRLLKLDAKLHALIAAAKNRAPRAVDHWSYRFGTRLREVGETFAVDKDFVNADFFLKLSLDLYKFCPASSKYGWNVISTKWAFARLLVEQSKLKEAATLYEKLLLELKKLPQSPETLLLESEYQLELTRFYKVRLKDPTRQKAHFDEATVLVPKITNPADLEKKAQFVDMLKKLEN